MIDTVVDFFKFNSIEDFKKREGELTDMKVPYDSAHCFTERSKRESL